MKNWMPFLQRALAATLDDSLSVEDLVALTLETGKFGVASMALLDRANTSAYGQSGNHQSKDRRGQESGNLGVRS